MSGLKNETEIKMQENKPEDLAYVIYTSGTTGMPKVIDMVPDLMNRFIGPKDISPEAEACAKEMKKDMESDKKE